MVTGIPSRRSATRILGNVALLGPALKELMNTDVAIPLAIPYFSYSLPISLSIFGACVFPGNVGSDYTVIFVANVLYKLPTDRLVIQIYKG